MRRLRLMLALAALALAAPAVAQGQSDYIVVFRDGTDVDAVVDEHVAQHGADVSHRYYHALDGYAARMTTVAYAAIRQDARVLFVSENRAVRPSSLCDPTALQCLPTGIDRIDADLSSAVSGDGAGAVDVNVAVLDTGIDLTHPDLNVAGGVSCQESAGLDDKNGHGTHVAGIIGAKDNGYGVVGVAPGARLWVARVLNQGGHTGPQGSAEGGLDELVCGVDWVTSTRTDLDPTNDIAVANMSLEGRGSDDGNCGLSNGDPLHLAICNSVAAGVLYVVAAGNSGVDLRDTISASYDEVLTATMMWDTDGQPGGLNQSSFPGRFSKLCVARDDTYIAFSNFARLPADRARVIAAPGVCIASTLQGGNYEGYFGGTSMAAAHVSGTAALCIAAGACHGEPAQIMQKLIGDARSY
ncbi:MAG: S8 family serine peptidase, partial [Gemmatimonadota bacterium]